MCALKSGSILLPASRNEIVDSLSTIIMLETKHPSANQLEKVALRLISVYPTIADKLPGGCPYASWKKKLQNKFKNLNRPERRRQLGFINETDETHQPTKKIKLVDDVSAMTTPSQEEEYQRNKLKLKQLYDSNKWSLTGMKSLMSETFEIRRQWICTENPTVEIILSEFPCLKEPDLLLHDFHRIVNLGESKILTGCRHILSYSRTSTKKEVIALLKDFNSIENPNDDHYIIYALAIASSLTSQRGKTKPSLFLTFQGDHVNIESSLDSIIFNHPVLVCFGHLKSAVQPMVIVERNNILKMPSFTSALKCCIACYYVFNIKYHVPTNGLCLLLEFLYGIDLQIKKLPLSVQQIIEGLL
jgi:hypothetical protein